MCISSWQLTKEKRRLPEPLWSAYEGKNEKKRLPTRNGKGQELHRVRRHDAMHSMEREGAWQHEEYNQECQASGACPDPITDPLGWCKYEWSRKGTHESPAWAGDLWSGQPHGPPTASHENGLLVGPS